MESFKSHILVVDDDEGIRSLLKQFLNENGYLVNTCLLYTSDAADD